MPTSFPRGRRNASARRPLLAVLTAAFILFQQVAFIIPAAAQTRRPSPRAGAATRTPSKSPAPRPAAADAPGDPSVPGNASTVFINEIHYDNAGTDADEGAEVAGPAGTNLAGWQLFHYNGNGGTVTSTTALSGTFTNQQNGYGTIFFAITGLQNDHEGLALVNTNTDPDTVVQFLSYENSVTATAGPANGMASTTIPVDEDPAPASGNSLQLTGTGATYGDFTWTGPATSSNDLPNTGQTFVAPADAAPTVSSTSPADGATNVPVNSDITITFSEPVFTADNWFSISCATSGTHAAPDGVGPTAFTLNPDTDFANGEVCTVTVFGSFVGDQDANDPPDEMAADYVFSFTTAPATPTLSVGDVSQGEGSGGGTTAFTFTVSLSTATHGGVTYDICSADGTAQDGGNVGEDTDYSPICFGAQTIPNGSDSAQHTVNVNADSTVEPDENFFVNITNPTGATIADSQGQGTIVNDDFVITPVYTIQGSGAASPVAGQVVTTTGVVTLLKTGSNAGVTSTANGFFLQTPDDDGNPSTSQGIFVFTNSVPTYTAGGAVAVGDELRVTGTVAEFNGLTEITSVTDMTVIDTGNTLPTAVTLDSTILDPAAAPTQPQLEKYEGMRLAAASLKTVAPNDDFFDVYTVLSSVARPVREPGIPVSDPVPPDPTTGTPDCCIPVWDENPERLKLDTNGRAGASNTPYTSGVTFTSVSGALDFGFDEYRLIPDAAPAASANMTAVPVPAPYADEFTVASYNIENFDNGSATQREKAALTVRTVLHYPEVIGLIEIDDLAHLRALADEINGDAVAAGDPDPQYVAYLSEGNALTDDPDQNVGFLVKTSRVSVTSVTQERKDETYAEPGGGTAFLHDRPPLVLDAVVDPSGANPQRVIVVVNHLRSFIGVELVAGDGPRVREKRKKQAESLADLLNDLQAANAGVPVISVGDYNAYQFNSGYDDPVSVIKGTPTEDDKIVVDQSPDLVAPDFLNLIDNLPAAEQYSFVFEGTPQALDHHVVNGAARARNTRIAVARVNSDFPENPAAAYASEATRPERNSDHDPVVSYYSLAEAQAAGTLIISEFRFHGQNFGEGTVAPKAGGGDDTGGPRAPGTPAENDEFVEFYNNTDADIMVSTLDGSPGWALVAADGQVRFIIPNGTVIPARYHFLAVNADGYSLCPDPLFECYGEPDLVLLPDGETPAFGYNIDIPSESGVALFRTANPSFFTAEERLDAAGYASVPELYREGAGLTPGPEVGAEIEYAWVRQMCAFVRGVGCTTAGTPKDTGVNAADFVSVDTSGFTQSLGAPGPEGLFSPVQRNAQFHVVLLDNQRAQAQTPNRVRDMLDKVGDNKSFGTMSIRRTVTNNTGSPVDYLAFRVVQITTFPDVPGQADLRVLNSDDITVTLSNGEEVHVSGTYVEEPPAQLNGGALNSSLGVGVINLGGVSLEDGESVNVQFLLGVVKTGSFRFYINVEAFEACGCPADAEWAPALKKLKAQKSQPRTSVQSGPRRRQGGRARVRSR